MICCDARPALINCLQALGRFLSRLSYYLSSYVFLLGRGSFATRKVYISLETLLCLLQLSDRTYVSQAPAMYRFIPPFGRFATT